MGVRNYSARAALASYSVDYNEKYGFPMSVRSGVAIDPLGRSDPASPSRYPLFTGTGMPATFSLTEPSVDRVVK
jgi:hypothetical protein